MVYYLYIKKTKLKNILSILINIGCICHKPKELLKILLTNS